MGKSQPVPPPTLGTVTLSYPMAPARFSLAEGGCSHTALCAAMRPSPQAISQGRAQCPLYMRLHDGSQGHC
ncbi:hypothetical protein MC885_009046 [Smutsia gigantea]|nr:hypothetical protein MC885_009046 [Smutsia gigantea]